MQHTQRDSDPRGIACVVYERRTGRVIYIHDFLLASAGVVPPSAKQMLREALDAANQLSERPTRTLAAALVDEKFAHGGAEYRFDVKTSRLVPAEKSAMKFKLVSHHESRSAGSERSRLTTVRRKTRK